MKRKVVRQGAATLMVSLPSKWAHKVHLKKGDEIDIEESNGNLVISKEKVETKKQTTINISSYSESSIRVALWNTYRAGYSRIVVNFSDEKQYKIVKDVIKNYVVGFDVTKKEKNSCIVENITEPAEEQFDVLFRKILYNISLLINITEERLRNKQTSDNYNEIVLKIHQYDNFCRRVIAKRNLSGSEAYLLWSFLTLLIHGQRELYHLNRYLDKNKVKFTNFEFYGKLRKIFDLLNEGYVKKDLSKFEKIHELEKDILYQEFYGLIQKNQKENIVLYHIAAAIRQFYLSVSPLVGLLLESNKS